MADLLLAIVGWGLGLIPGQSIGIYFLHWLHAPSKGSQPYKTPAGYDTLPTVPLAAAVGWVGRGNRRGAPKS